ncbi:MAG TPA: PepSY domain-containing protein, partial [Burkholderiaceae bacterium]|nr:PepSY domain-containing protein [Burkholderiaceae bacterium]
LVTGLTWARYSGENFRVLQEALGQDAPKAPTGLRSVLPAQGAQLSWQDAYERARAGAPDVSMQLTAPRGIDGTWRAENFDRSQPDKRFVRVFDAYSARLLFVSDWERLPLLAKATAVGIPFHRGEFGLWNQAVLGLAALAAIFSVVSGVVMWQSRRPRGRVAAPSFDRQHLRGVPLWVGGLALGLAAALPVFGGSLLLFVVLESLRLAWPRRGRASAA